MEISFREMFEVPTVSRLAAAVMRELMSGMDSVAQLAEAVVRELASAMDNDDLEKMIAEIGDLSAEELRDSIEAER